MTEEPFLPKLIKIMGMTTNSNDNQALVAMRMANKLLASQGACWETLLRGKITIIEDPFARINTPERRDHDRDIPRAPARPNRTPPPPPPPSSSPPPFTTATQARARPQPQPAPQPQTPRQTINKFAGTCVLCNNIVAATDGFAIQRNGRWETEHKPGQCPPRRPKSKRFAKTADDLL